LKSGAFALITRVGGSSVAGWVLKDAANTRLMIEKTTIIFMKETFMKRYNFRNLYPKLVDCISLILFYPFLMFYYPKDFSIKKTD
jgi:hypothetical protein